MFVNCSEFCPAILLSTSANSFFKAIISRSLSSFLPSNLFSSSIFAILSLILSFSLFACVFNISPSFSFAAILSSIVLLTSSLICLCSSASNSETSFNLCCSSSKNLDLFFAFSIAAAPEAAAATSILLNPSTIASFAFVNMSPASETASEKFSPIETAASSTPVPTSISSFCTFFSPFSSSSIRAWSSSPKNDFSHAN